nr:HNH endonuclease [uncultured Treponema sp.]
MSQILIAGTKYEKIDTKTEITLADSFTKNKLGSAHGEAKLYLGMNKDGFFDDLNSDFFFLKQDFENYMNQTKSEFFTPKHNYQNKKKLAEKFNVLKQQIDSFENKPLIFNFTKREVSHPGIYVSAESPYYNLIRDLGLSDFSYLSVMKLKNLENHKIEYYCQININESALIQNEDYILEEIEGNEDISSKIRKQLIDSRIGQGIYRKKLLEECPFCPFTQIDNEALLNASHIKPWKKSNNMEKTDPKNGFIFTPTYDRLFDRGFITFTDSKELIISNWISELTRKQLKIEDGMIINDLPVCKERLKYLKFHRENEFKKLGN